MIMRRICTQDSSWSLKSCCFFIIYMSKIFFFKKKSIKGREGIQKILVWFVLGATPAPSLPPRSSLFYSSNKLNLKLSLSLWYIDDSTGSNKSLKNQMEFKGWTITNIAVIVSLCVFFYIIGAWQSKAGSQVVEVVPEGTTRVGGCSSSSADLNFDAHHTSTESSTFLRASIKPCGMKYSEYTPCEDPKRALSYPRERLVHRERHCPSDTERLHCLIPAPPGYKNPFQWPKSREAAWYANVPHKELTVEKAIQNWIQYEGDTFRFPGGGTMFPNGADAYINDIDALISLSDGTIRTALDTGCGVASWGAYLLDRDILAMSFAPRDSHKAQVQFALERGVPAMIGVLSTKRMPYPARAFDMAHCSRCLIPWSSEDGAYLIEVDRVLRPGGYWILSGPPINWETHWQGWKRSKENLKEEQDAIEELAERLCWKKVVEKGDLAIWQKPRNHLNCIKSRKAATLPHICKGENPDLAWYQKLETCITPLPEVSEKAEVAGGELEKWPKRLNAVPPRILSRSLPGITVESFNAENQLWIDRISYYKKHVTGLLGTERYRNIMDMNAGLGGFAAALASNKLWVMNVVPSDAKDNTLGVIYERGLIGTYQNWCEAFSTYPRTYDLLHASGVISMYRDRCNMEDILIEMDRILRPEGAVIMRDDVDVLTKVKSLVNGMRWQSKIVDHESGPFSREKILVAVKTYWVGEEKLPSNSTKQS